MEKTHPRLVKINEAAGMLAISTRQVWRLIAAGELPKPLKVGGASRLMESDLAEYITKLEAVRG
jgi:excisionase family DNA binding protein